MHNVAFREAKQAESINLDFTKMLNAIYNVDKAPVSGILLQNCHFFLYWHIQEGKNLPKIWKNKEIGSNTNKCLKKGN
jgi:hypothetical protein